MSLRSSLSVFLGLDFSSAGKLLRGADRGNTEHVKQVRQSFQRYLLYRRTLYVSGRRYRDSMVESIAVGLTRIACTLFDCRDVMYTINTQYLELSVILLNDGAGVGKEASARSFYRVSRFVIFPTQGNSTRG